MMKFSGASKYLKYLPGGAVVYAAYQEYADRGIDGIMADLQSISFEGVKAKATNIVMGVGAFIVGDLVAKQVSNSYAKVAVKTVAYYIGTKQLLGALRQGAGFGGGRVSVSPATTMITSPVGRGGRVL